MPKLDPIKAKVRILYLPALLIYLLGLVYLILPSPATPDLTNSVRSTEPGDTWQNPTQKAFFTQKDRGQVLFELQSAFSLQGFPLKGYRLNYPPEEAFTLVRDQLPSYYLEEIVHPLRESLFINGWEPQNSPKYSYLPAEDRPGIVIDGVTYQSKVTINPAYSPLWARLFVWTMIFPASYLVYLSVRKSFIYG